MDKSRAPLVAIGVMLIALGFAVVDTGKSGGVAAPDTWTAAVESGADHIAPDALASLLLENPGQLLLVDVRLPEEFGRFHLPGAINLDLVSLLGPAGTEALEAAEGKTIVLMSNGMTHPAQAWVALTEAGRSNVRILEDGLDGFIRSELTPPSLRGATTQTRAQSEAARFVALQKLLLSASAASAPSLR